MVKALRIKGRGNEQNIKERRNKKLKNRNNELIVHHRPCSPVTEAYRQVRANLDFLSPDSKIKSLVVTSSLASEGKSPTLANIAITLAQNGKKVIIIDADLRKPMQHSFFEMPNYKGLSNILTGEIEYIQGKQETFIEGVSIIPAGIIPPNPTELLDSKKMHLILEKACLEADMVLIDTPPVIPVSDAVLLSHKSDGVLLIVASHQTPGVLVVKTCETLKKAKANIVGVVLNKYPVEKGLNHYKYYQCY